VLQATEVAGRDGGGGLDLDPDDVALAVLQDRVDLDLVLGAVVKQLGALPLPRQLAGQLHQHEALEQRTELPADAQQAAGVLAEQVGPVTRTTRVSVSASVTDASACRASSRPSGLELTRTT
jgi:hypothetical protein